MAETATACCREWACEPPASREGKSIKDVTEELRRGE